MTRGSGRRASRTFRLAICIGFVPSRYSNSARACIGRPPAYPVSSSAATDCAQCLTPGGCPGRARLRRPSGAAHRTGYILVAVGEGRIVAGQTGSEWILLCRPDRRGVPRRTVRTDRQRSQLFVYLNRMQSRDGNLSAASIGTALAHRSLQCTICMRLSPRNHNAQASAGRSARRRLSGARSD